MPDKSFLVQCTCAGDVCQCDDFSTGGRHRMQSQPISNQPINQPKKDDPTMNQLFADALRGSKIRGNVKIPFSKTQQYSTLSDI
jgi:hypothetical protein